LFRTVNASLAVLPQLHAVRDRKAIAFAQGSELDYWATGPGEGEGLATGDGVIGLPLVAGVGSGVATGG